MNKKYCLWTVLLWAVLLLVSACGDDGTSANSDVLGDSDELTSSSVVSSSGKASSSSVADSAEILPDSSSDKKTASSSSSSSAGNVRRSSSSSISWIAGWQLLSSSSYSFQPFNLAHFEYKEFTDPRNNRTYKYLKFEGKDTVGKVVTIYAMAENLNIGEMVNGNRDQKNDEIIERYCYDNDTAYCDIYGGLYQWAEMMQFPSECNTKVCDDLIQPNHQGICPEGWRLLTYNDFYIIVNSNGNKDGIKGTRSAFGFGGNNDTGFSLVGAGAREDKGQFTRLKDGAYFYYPIEQENTNGERAGAVGMGKSATLTPLLAYNDKNFGFSVRCVMLETESAPE
ncbi:MAG: hypothetical protein J6T62_11140 [Fibrobacter sp.]|nr:hypothetical protein [Fibrobacter sp.]